MPKLPKPDNDNILRQQSYFVAKRNDLVQKSRYELTTDQNKALLYLISKIKPFDTGNEVYEIPVTDFFKVCNEDNIDDAKNTLQAIADKSVWVENRRGVILLRWLKRVFLNMETMCFEVSFSEDMFPYLYDLRERYVQYSLENILVMKSRYGIRLYELLKSYERLKRNIEFTVDELKRRLDAENYTRYPDFKRRVLEPAVNDINECSDIEVSYTAIQGEKRATERIVFSVRQPDFALMVQRMMRKQQLLEGRRRRQ